MDQQKKTILEEYWFRKLSEPFQPLRLPACEMPAAELPASEATMQTEVPIGESARLRRVSRDSDLLLFVLTVSSLSILLHRYTEQNDLVIGTELPGGPGEPLLLRVSVSSGQRLEQLIEQTRAAIIEAFNYGDYPAAQLFHALEARGLRNPLNLARVGCAYAGLHGPAPSLSRYDIGVLLESRDGALNLRISFDPAVYSLDLIERFGANLGYVMEQLPKRLERTVNDLSVVCPRQEAELSALARGPESNPYSTVHAIFEEHARRAPEEPAIVDAGTVTTYRQLNEKANLLAQALAGCGVQSGDRVALLAEASTDAIVGMAGIAKAGGCYVPICPGDPIERLQTLVADSDCAALVTTKAHQAIAERLAVSTLYTDALDAKETSPRESARDRPDDALYVMYTSGTSGTPKGVIVEHRSVVRLVRDAGYIRFDAGDRILQGSPLEFDASTFEIWGALLNGLTLVLCSKEDLLEAQRLKTVIADSGVTIAWLTAPLFARHAEADPTVFAGLKYLLTGGDVVSPRHANLVKHQCPWLTVINGYGPTENTTFSTAFTVDREFGERVPIGRPIANATAFVLNAGGALQPMNVVGELYVGGDGLARGYLGDPELTRARFVSRLGQERLYKTGDLARWRPDGQLEFIGRVDDQVKIRGYRVEPSEVERRLREHPSVLQAVVVPVQSPAGETQLCAYTVGAALEDGELAAFLKRLLPHYMIPGHFVRLERLALTASGKVDRSKLPSPFERTRADDGPRDEMEGKLEAIWREILEVSNIGMHEDFFDLGGHSMKAIQLISHIQKEFGVNLGLQHVLKSITISDLAGLLQETRTSRQAAIERQPPREFFELTVSQRRLADLYAKDPDNPAFNICCRYHWDRELDAGIVNRVIAELVARHDNLRAHFELREGRFVQLVRRGAPVEVTMHDLRGLSQAGQERRLSDLCQAEETIPFQLETPPLHRLHLAHHGMDESELLWTMHHIISDGWSMNVLERELRHLYQRFLEGKDNDLAPVALQFTDLAVWQSQLLQDQEKMRLAKAYWAGVLRPPLHPLPLPYDFERSKSSVGRRSAGYRAVIDEETTAGLRQLAKEQKTGLFMVLFTGFNRLLAEFTETEDIVTAIPSANRYQHELKDTVGFLVDSAIVRNRIDLDMPVDKALRQVNVVTLRSMDHAYYPIELACETAGTTWPEILSTFFNMSTFGDTNHTILADTRWRALEQVQNAKLEVVFYLTEYKNGVEVAVHYYTDLFLPATIENLAKRYGAILEEMTQGPVWRRVSAFDKRSEPLANAVS